MTVHRHSRSALFLMEIIIVILFFVISAAVCVRVFTLAAILNRDSRNLNGAVIAAESAAAAYKSAGGDLAKAALVLGGEVSGDTLNIYLAEDWQETEQKDAAFAVRLEGKDALYPNQKNADITVTTTDGQAIYTLNIKTSVPASF